jgi:hypothetical protein
MNIEQLIELAENRIKFLANLKQIYLQEGNVELYEKYTADLETTKQTLEKLKSVC